MKRVMKGETVSVCTLGENENENDHVQNVHDHVLNVHDHVQNVG